MNPSRPGIQHRHVRRPAIFLAGLLLMQPLRAEAQPDASTSPGTSSAVATSSAPVPNAADSAGRSGPPSFTLGSEISLRVSDSVEIRLSPPEPWISVEAADLDVPELANVPGAKVVHRHVWRSNPHSGRTPLYRLSVMCATAPSYIWVQDGHDMVFRQMDGVARADLSEWMDVDNLLSSESSNEQSEGQQLLRFRSFGADGRVSTDGKPREQRGAGGGKRLLQADDVTDSVSVLGRGRHVIGFLSNPDVVLACTTTCMEPTSRNLQDGKGEKICPAIVDSMRLEGALASEPSTSPFAKLLMALQHQRGSLVGIAVGLLLAVVGIIAIARGVLLRSPAA